MSCGADWNMSLLQIWVENNYQARKTTHLWPKLGTTDSQWKAKATALFHLCMCLHTEIYCVSVCSWAAAQGLPASGLRRAAALQLLFLRLQTADQQHSQTLHGEKTHWTPLSRRKTHKFPLNAVLFMTDTWTSTDCIDKQKVPVAKLPPSMSPVSVTPDNLLSQFYVFSLGLSRNAGISSLGIRTCADMGPGFKS